MHTGHDTLNSLIVKLLKSLKSLMMKKGNWVCLIYFYLQHNFFRCLKSFILKVSNYVLLSKITSSNIPHNFMHFHINFCVFSKQNHLGPCLGFAVIQTVCSIPTSFCRALRPTLSLDLKSAWADLISCWSFKGTGPSPLFYLGLVGG